MYVIAFDDDPLLDVSEEGELLSDLSGEGEGDEGAGVDVGDEGPGVGVNGAGVGVGEEGPGVGVKGTGVGVGEEGTGDADGVELGSGEPEGVGGFGVTTRVYASS